MTELFHEDRTYAAPPDAISSVRLEPDELLPGDVLLFRGTHLISNGIRFWDDCCFDHGALVVERPTGELLLRYDESLHNDPWVRDISYFGVRTYPLSIYEDVPTHVLVRRHRIAGWREPVVAFAEEVKQDTAGYNFQHSLTLIVASLTRTATRLRENADNWDARFGDENLPLEKFVGSQPRYFAANMHRLFEAAAARIPESDQHVRICVEYVRDCFDVLSDQGGGADSQYYGLVLEDRPHDGLLAWAASGQTFVTYLHDGAAPGVADEVSFDPEQELRAMAIALGLSVSVLAYRDPEEITDEDVRRSVIQSAHTTLRFLGWRPGRDTPAFPPAAEAVPAMAAYLLDQLLRRRHLISQFDIASTKTLYDAGLLNVAAVNWQPNTKLPPDNAPGAST
jgi:hypothetical protein